MVPALLLRVTDVSSKEVFMKNTILKSTLVATAVLLSGMNANAKLATIEEGTQLQIRTSLIGKQIAGVMPEGIFVSIQCRAHTSISFTKMTTETSYSADILFPNSHGDVVTERYDSAAPRVSAAAAERSTFLPLSQVAAQFVCENPAGNYVLEVRTTNSVKQIELLQFRPDLRLLSSAHITAGQTLKLRTGQVGEKIVGVSEDGNFVAIVCSQGTFSKSTADMIYPNSSHNIITNNYAGTATRVNAVNEERGAFVSLTSEAVVQICNNPNGLYTLSVNAAEGETKVALVSIDDKARSVEANTRFRTRGF